MEIISKTIGKLIGTVAEERPDHPAIVHGELSIRYTYGQLWGESVQVARGLLALGVGKGDRIAIWGPNVPEWVTSMLALARIGAVMIPIDPGASVDNLGYILSQSESRGIIFSSNSTDPSREKILGEVRSELPDLEVVVSMEDTPSGGMISWSQLKAAGKDWDSDSLGKVEKEQRPDDPIAIMYSSGTTGNPKGVVLDHLGLVNKSLFSTQRQGIDGMDRLCLFFPLFHMFGNTCITLAGLLRGATLVMPSRDFNPERILQAISAEACTAIYGSPSMIVALLEHPSFEKRQWQQVRKGIIGGAPCPMALMKRLVEDIGISDITVGYGLTETASWITMTRPDDPIELRVSTVGMPLACNEVRVISPATGEVLPAGTQGEICARGFIMKEYYKMPGATNAAIDREGWLHSGDLGEMDENGYVRITGRLKDVIVRNGVEIYPVELEEVLYTLPGVSEAQVFGYPHPEMGQEVAAWVRVKEDSGLSPYDIAAYVEERISPEQATHHYKIVSNFPMTRSGKIQKFKLAQMAAEEYADSPGV